jgi:hypothetical protein
MGDLVRKDEPVHGLSGDAYLLEMRLSIEVLSWHRDS